MFFSLPDVPKETDPDFSDVMIRKHICQDIIVEEFFSLLGWGWIFVDEYEIYVNRNDPQYKYIFQQIYTPLDPETLSFEYTNRYREREFHINNFTRITDYVFICPMKDITPRRYGFLIPYYVSKEYNVNPVGQPHMPGRFIIFSKPVSRYLHSSYSMIFAEEPARVYTEPHFNVELYYLQIRRHTKPGKILHSLCTIVMYAFK